MNKFIPSKYQVAIFEAAHQTNDNLLIEACAGSGKSTTLEYLVDGFDQLTSILVLAFNRDITTALQSRISHMGAEISTINAFGSKVLRSNLKYSKLNAKKTDDAFRQNCDNEGHFWKYKSTINRMCELLRSQLQFSYDKPSVGLIADQFDVDLPDDNFFEYLKDTYNAILRDKTTHDFRDQVSLPVYLNLTIPKYDVVLIDEVQDLDKGQAELVLRAVGGKIIMVGDSRQGIYGFRGAMAAAMADLKKRTNAKQLPLSISYRCPVAVVKLAQTIVPDIEHSETAKQGLVTTIKRTDFSKNVREGDFVLCRCTAPLVSACFGLIREGRKATVKGREIGEQLAQLVDKISLRDRGISVGDFLQLLIQYRAKQLDALHKSNKEELILALTDKCDTVEVLAEGATYVGDILNKITEVFTDAVKGVVFMTIHKSKGLENCRVFILAPELLPHPSAKSAAQRTQEMNLKYVAITRTKFDANNEGELFWVSSK